MCWSAGSNAPGTADRLGRSGLTISGIAYEVGFGDLSYFNRSFRKRYGQSPSQVKSNAAHSS